MQHFILHLSIEPTEGIELDPDVLEEIVRLVIENSTAREAILTGIDGSIIGDLVEDVDLALVAYLR